MNSTLSSSSFCFTTPSFSGVLVAPKTLSVPSSSLFSSSSINFISRKLNRGSNVIRACSLPVPQSSPKNLILHQLKTYAGAAVILAAAFSLTGRTARAEPSPVALTEESPATEETETIEDQSSPLRELLESSPESIDSLKQLLQKKLENGEDEEALKILRRMVCAQPTETEWKFLLARLLNETSDTQNARKVFEEILAGNPLSFEALFENALLMDRCGEGEAVITRLEEALRIAEEENKAKEARDVRLIMAQVQFLQKNVEDALRSYQELTKEDPDDFRPYFCQGMIFSLMDKNEEAREQFAKYRELSPKKFEVEGYLRTPLSRMKLFGTDDSN